MTTVTKGPPTTPSQPPPNSDFYQTFDVLNDPQKEGMRAFIAKQQPTFQGR
jgi:hypothetical protein